MAEAFDTLAVTEQLQIGGLDENQSKAVARAINGALVDGAVTQSNLDNSLEKLWMKFRIHMYLTQGTLFLALIAILKDWSQIFGSG